MPNLMIEKFFKKCLTFIYCICSAKSLIFILNDKSIQIMFSVETKFIEIASLIQRLKYKYVYA